MRSVIDAATGETLVSVARMARETGMGAATIYEVLRELCALGWITRERRPNRSAITRLVPQAFRDGKSERLDFNR